MPIIKVCIKFYYFNNKYSQIVKQVENIDGHAKH